MPNVTLKRHDLHLKFTDVLRVNGAAVELTGATVSFVLRSQATGQVLKRAATVVNASAGAVEYQPVAEDVATAGVFDQEWEVVFGSSAPLTFPTQGYNTITILEDLG